MFREIPEYSRFSRFVATMSVKELLKSIQIYQRYRVPFTGHGIMTDFRNFQHRLLKILLHLKRVATLPCETLIQKLANSNILQDSIAVRFSWS